MKTVNYSVIILSIFLLLISCKGEDGIVGPKGDVGATGESGPKLIGKLAGNVKLIDKYGKTKNNHQEILVTIGNQSKTTITDSLGYWEIDEIETGTYDLTFSKENYGASTVNSFSFTGGGITYLDPLLLGEIDDYIVSLDSIKTYPFFEGYTFLVYSDIDIPDRTYEGGKAFRAFVGLNQNVSCNPEDYLYTEKHWVHANFEIGFGTEYLIKSGFNRGDRIYICVYACNPSETNSNSFDFATGRYLYTDIAPQKSNVVSFIIE